MKIGGICLVARNAVLAGLALAICACTVVDIEKDRTLRELRGDIPDLRFGDFSDQLAFFVQEETE